MGLRLLLTVGLGLGLGAVGCAPGAPSLPDGVLPIGAVQGVGERSPLEGETVTVQGVLTARFPGRAGFFLQSAPGEADRDPTTSDAIFISLSEDAAFVLEPGDRVRVTGTVAELGTGPRTLTAILAGDLVALEGSGSQDRASGAASGAILGITPVILTQAPASPEAWDPLEGMLVRIEAPLTVSGQFGLRRFGEVITSFEGRLYQPTELHAPGPDADQAAAANAARTLVLDDGTDAQWPETVSWLAPSLGGGWPSDEAPFRAGSTLGPVTGIVDVRRGAILFLPISPVEIVTQAPRPEAPVVPEAWDGEAQLRVAVLNVENLFNGDGMGGGFPTPRGAETLEGWRLQQAKLVATLQAMDADVAALSEVENDGVGPQTALRQFVDALNAAGPQTDWRAIERVGPGTDAIRTALIYRASVVRPVGPSVVPEDPIFEWGSRPPLGQAFQVIGGDGNPLGDPWLVVSNHLKSKGGCPDEANPRARPGDLDQGDGQSCWNAHRTEAAHAIARWLASDPAGLAAASAEQPAAWQNALIVGDLNSYGREDPIRTLEDAGWIDAFAAHGEIERAARARDGAPALESHPPYSYVFQGQSGRLDHALIHESRASRLIMAAHWHTNADEDTGFGYAETLARALAEGRAGAEGRPPQVSVWRSSDHDPLIVVVRTGR
jgi:predicted extracellular nuclease